MLRFQELRHAKVPGWTLPLLFVLLGIATFFSGSYIGRYDAEKMHEKQSKFMQSSTSADELRLYGVLLEQAHEGRVDAMIRMLEFKAQLASQGAADCLSTELCARFAAAAPEAQSQLRSFVVKYGDTSTGGNQKQLQKAHP